jgi:hypothetical protein
MVTKYINRLETKKVPEEKKTPSIKKPIPVKVSYWYRVAIMYNSDQDFYYTKVVDQLHHQVMIEGEVNFVRWEPAMEYSV